MIIYTFFAGFIIMLASLGGILFVWNGFGTFFQRNARFLTTFSAGVFFIVVYSLFEEALHINTPPLSIILGALGGALLLEILMRLIPHVHHHHSATDCTHAHSHIDARRMMIGDAIHNIGDGVLLVPAFLIDIRVGAVITLGIFLHEAVQGMAEFFILKQAGYSTKRALLFNFIINSTILLGIIISAILSTIAGFTGIFLSIAAGGFVYVLTRDLVPHTLHAIRCGSKLSIHTLALICGMGLMFGISHIAPHHHDATDDHHVETHNTSNETHAQ